MIVVRLSEAPLRRCEPPYKFNVELIQSDLYINHHSEAISHLTLLSFVFKMSGHRALDSQWPEISGIFILYWEN